MGNQVSLANFILAAAAGGMITLIFKIVWDWLKSRNSEPQSCDSCKCLERIQQCEGCIVEIKRNQATFEERTLNSLRELERLGKTVDTLTREVSEIGKNLAALVAIAERAGDRKLLFQKR